MPRAPRTKRRRRHRNPKHDPHWHTQAGPVTITAPDGTVTEQPALTPKQLRETVRQRPNITPATRARISRRDNGACRYCHDTVGPHQIDHVVPIALGGTNHPRNLVLACENCNRRKGANVWKPRKALER